MRDVETCNTKRDIDIPVAAPMHPLDIDTNKSDNAEMTAQHRAGNHDQAKGVDVVVTNGGMNHRGPETGRVARVGGMWSDKEQSLLLSPSLVSPRSSRQRIT